MDFALAEVGRPLGLEELLGHAFELSLADVGEVHAVGRRGGIFVEEARDFKLFPDAFAEALRHLDALFDRHVDCRDERDDVGGAHARVLAVVLRHVYDFGGFFRELEGDFFDRLGRTYEGEDAAVVVAVGLRVEQRAAGYALRDVDERVVGGFVLFFAAAEVRNALDKFGHVVSS